MKSSILLLLFFTVLLSGCASKRDQLVEEGHPPAYADGFDDGYHTGKNVAGDFKEHYKKDVNRFDRDKKYAAGWKNGFRQGTEEQKELDKNIALIAEKQEAVQEQIEEASQKSENASGSETP